MGAHPVFKNELTDFRDTLLVLLKLCKEGHSGTMYLYTDEGHGAIYSIENGNIVDVFFRNLHGMEAVEQMVNTKEARFFVKGKNADSSPIKERSLENIGNDEIFRKFGIEYSEVSNPTVSNAKKILVVEDSGLARKVVVEALKAQGYDVVEARDGEEAIQQIAKCQPDLVLLDLILPKIDGYDVLSSMKANVLQKQIPVIVLTSRDTLFDKLKGKMSGTDEYMTKPVDTVELKTKLRKYLG